MRWVHYIIGTIFALFSLVQFNDPDFYIWVPLYLIPAFFAFSFPKRKFSRTMTRLIVVFYLIGAVYLSPPSLTAWISAEEKAKSLGMTLPGIEQARESMGLMLCAWYMAYIWWKSKK